jgi:hypothetical protein
VRQPATAHVGAVLLPRSHVHHVVILKNNCKSDEVGLMD